MLGVTYKIGEKFKPHYLLLCVALAGSVLTACGTDSAKSSSESPAANQGATEATVSGENTRDAAKREQTFKDELGHEIQIPAQPQRVFAPYLEDSLLKLGVKPVAQWSNGNLGHDYLQGELQDVPKLDFSGGAPSSEVLLSYEPDLIILHTANYAGNGVYENYSKIAPTYVFSNAAGDVEKSLETLGELLGKSEEAKQAIESYHQKVDEAKAVIEKNAPGKKVAIVRFAAKGVSLMGGNYFCGYVLNQQLGIEMTKLTENENSLNLSLEILPEMDADYIFVINAYGQGTERMKEMTESSIWKSIPAVQQGNVYEVSDEYWLGSGLIAYEKIIDDTVKLMTE
ncbi:ABC transporter substrate-binding protein [Paenibacillus lentus]|uniref:ABC transporter substrate-binding protein n=1 Tax=Paenibacillus lentus TaxID=1338368 RepID=A0A3Q8SD56_9BACL|nr:ABC transporter substrate-binding protein [Paenibacillus lentus]AZK47905.1 ABC transporter substrate-binding protein [Paenibacillus lentus]